MPCLDENTVVALVEGRLADDTTAKVHEHTAECPACRRLVAALARSETQGDGTKPTLEARKRDRDVALADTHVSGESEVAGDDLSAGTKIGRYAVVKKLGAGGMGSVYLATDSELDREVAIKVLHSGSDAGAERLLREARAMAKLRHPNVVTVFEVSRDEGDVFVAMEFIDGVTLREWLKGDHNLEDRLNVLRQAGAGLAAAHAKGLVHRDFKPDNVMVSENDRVQVLDFGLAKPAVSAATEEPAPSDARPAGNVDLTQTGALVGTPAYMAPEQFAHGRTDERTDQFAFCIVAFEALHGIRPFDGESLVELADAVLSGESRTPPKESSVPPPVSRALGRGLQVSPEDRFESMQPLLRTLRRTERKRRWLVPGALIAAAAASTVAILASSQASNTTLLEPVMSPREALLASSDLPEEIPTPLPGDPLKLTVHRLSNGLTVYISPNKKRSVVSWRMIFRVGARDNPPGVGGLAHIAEHLSYAGTAKLGSLDYKSEVVHLNKIRELYAEHAAAETASQRAQIMETIDAENTAASQYAIHNEYHKTSQLLGVRELNAQAGLDVSTYSAEVPSQRFAAFAKLEAERWTGTVFRFFHTESSAIFHEKRRRESVFGWAQKGIDILHAEAYAGHPYASLGIGTYDEILAEPLLALERFWATWYAPNNAALVLVGDIDATVALPILEREFSKWRPRSLPTRVPTAPPRRSQPVERELLSSGTTALFVAYPVPPTDSTVDRFVAAASEIMKERIELRKERGEARLANVAASVVGAAEGAMIMFVVIAAPNQSTEEASEVFDSLIASLKRGDFDTEALQAAALNQERERAKSLEDDSGRLELIGEAFARRRPWREIVGEVGSTPLSKKQVVDLAEQLLHDGRVVLKVKPGTQDFGAPKQPTVSPSKTPTDKKSAFTEELLAIETIQQSLKLVYRGQDYDIRDSNLGPLIAVKNRDNDLYELTMYWAFGFETEPLVCHALAALDQDGGLESIPAAARKRRWYGRANVVSHECYESEVSVTLRGLHASFDIDVAELREWLTGAGLSEAGWTKAVTASAEFMAQTNNEIPLFELMRFAGQGKSYPWHTTLTRGKLLTASHSEALKALAALTETRRTIRYFGPHEFGAVNFGANQPRRAATVAPPFRLLPIEKPRIIVADQTDGRAADALVLFGIGPLDEKDVPAAQITESLLAERINSALQKRLGSAYSARVVLIVPHLADADASFAVGFALEPERLSEALEIVMAATKAPIQTGFADARLRTIERYRTEWIKPRDLPGKLGGWFQRGLKDDPRPIRFAQLAILGPDMAAAFAERVQKARIYVAITGDMKHMRLDRLRSIGTVIDRTNR